MRYRYEYMNQGQLGELFGTTSHVVGKWLKELKLRNGNGKPSSEAFEKHLLSQNYDENGTYGYVWHVERTVAEFERAGHKRIPNPPQKLAEASKIKGPFELRAAENGTWQLVGSDNEVAIVVTGEANAIVVKRLLNMAHRGEMLEQMFTQ